MAVGTLIYFFKEAVRGFYQAKLMTFVSIMSITASLCFMNGAAIAFLNVEDLIDKGTDQADIAAYFNDSYSVDGEDDSLLSYIKGVAGVRKVSLVSKDSAWERFSMVYGKEILEAVDDNPLPVSVELFMFEKNRSQEHIEAVAATLRALPQIESVRFSSEWISLVEGFKVVFWVVVAVVGVIILFILYFMIANTIKLTIYARKELVSHMQMVGATAFFIKMPFVLEGMLQGCIGGILCFFVMGVLRVVLMGFAINWGPQQLFFLVTLFLGVGFGWLGSAGVVRKFLV